MTLLEFICIAGFVHEIHPPAHVQPGQPIHIGWVFPTEEPCDEPSGISGKLERVKRIDKFLKENE